MHQSRVLREIGRFARTSILSLTSHVVRGVLPKLRPYVRPLPSPYLENSKNYRRSDRGKKLSPHAPRDDLIHMI